MKTLFLVEDDANLTRMYERMFRLKGYKVVTESDGQKAIDRLRTLGEKPAAVLLDIMIPTVSGIDVLRTIKADKELKDIPVVILTNTFVADNEKLFLSLGASLYIMKMDSNIQNVIERVQKCLSGEEETGK